jgi:hypothetical protein
MSTNSKTAPYGSWQSPITSDLIVTQSISLSEVRFDGQAVYWLEARPQEEGRNVVVRAGGAGASTTDIVPKPFNVRTRVHEYGGGAWTVAFGVLYFSNFADGRLYRFGATSDRALSRLKHRFDSRRKRHENQTLSRY